MARVVLMAAAAAAVEVVAEDSVEAWVVAAELVAAATGLR